MYHKNYDKIMTEILKKHGYREAEIANEWVKKSWTIRLFNDEIEAFNEPRINTPGLYFKGPKTLENLLDIIYDIDSM